MLDRPNAGWGACENEVPFLQRDKLGDLFDKFRYGPDHMFCGAVLSALIVDVEI